MNWSTLASSVATCLCLGLACPVLAAQPQDAVAAPAITAAPSAASVAQSPTPGAVKQPSSDAASASAAMPAEKCLDDLRAFNSEMEKTGYWMGGSGYGYGYPVGGFGGRPIGPAPIGAEAGYQDARPGYEIRTLLASADILAQHGQQQACEDVLSTTRSMDKMYAADMRTEGVRTADVPNWRQQEIGAARPVTGQDTSFRSDELLGTAVVNPQGQALGSVNDIVTSRQTGQIAYLVIGRGGSVRDWRILCSGPLDGLQDNAEREPTRARHHRGRHDVGPTGKRERIQGRWELQPGKPKGGCVLESAVLEHSRQPVKGLTPVSIPRDGRGTSMREERAMLWNASKVNGYAISASNGRRTP